MMVIGIAGGSGSGKTTVVRALTEQLNEKVVVLPQDSYYKDSSWLPLEERQKVNFDHPDSIDFPLLVSQLQKDDRAASIFLSYMLPVKDRDHHCHSCRSHHHRRYPHLHMRRTAPADGHKDICGC